MLPRITMQKGAFAADTASRVMGALSGSRVAGALGRVVARDLLGAVLAPQRGLGFEAGPGGPIVMGTYVDNILVLANDASGAEALLTWAHRGTHLHDVVGGG